MEFKENFNEIINLYDCFIFDVWGVIHDGTHAYPDVVETILRLRKMGKKVCFLSNAPRRSQKVADVLEKYGITKDFYDFILTSGEATFFDLHKNQENNFTSFGKNYYYIGPQKDLDLLDGLNYKRVENAKDANFVLVTGFDGEYSVLEEKLSQIQEAKKHDLPFICVNPDLIVVKKDGREMLCAGVLAHEYEKMGGVVTYYGKPYQKVYEITYDLLGRPNKNKIVAIGDGLETDIEGANAFNIDSVLITSGILCNKLGVKYGQKADKSKLNVICSLQKTFPKYVISNI